jgi:tetratricopeptide (TPR) repeat protein
MKPDRNGPRSRDSGEKYRHSSESKTESGAPVAEELNRLVALFQAGRHGELESQARALLARHPENGFAWKLLSAALHLQGKDTYESLQKAVECLPQDAELHSNLGNVLLDRGLMEKAIESYRRALAIRPDLAEAHYNLGVARQDQGKPDEAASGYRRALELKPDYAEAHNNLAFILLMQGKYERGWKEYEWHWQRTTGKPYVENPSQPGTLLPRPSSYLPVRFSGKRFFLLADQGIGDELCFLRFAPEIRRRGGWVAYRASPKLQSLLARSKDLDLVVGANECPPDIDHSFLVNDSPLVLGMRDHDPLPPPLPLAPLPEHTRRMRAQLEALGSGPFLGVTWWAGIPPMHGVKGTKFQFKQIPPAELAAALRQWPGQILVLQRNPSASEIDEFANALGRPVHDFSWANEDLEAMLALLSLLDDYVGVSNANMHLSAGLGKPCRVLVSRYPDWRWRAEAESSPWFPGYRAYRQGSDESWDEALEKLAQELALNR